MLSVSKSENAVNAAGRVQTSVSVTMKTSYINGLFKRFSKYKG